LNFGAMANKWKFDVIQLKFRVRIFLRKPMETFEVQLISQTNDGRIWNSKEKNV